MATTGFKIQVKNTVLGENPQVNANSMLVVVGAVAEGAFSLDTPELLRSLDDLEALGVTEERNAHLIKQVGDFFAPTPNLNNNGTILWLVGVSDGSNANNTVKTKLADWVRATVVNGFEFRPRQILIADNEENADHDVKPEDVQTVITELYTEGFSTVAIIGASANRIGGDISQATVYNGLEDMSDLSANMVGYCIVTDVVDDHAIVGKLGGWLASLSVGTSVGDVSLGSFAQSLYFCDEANTPCAKISLACAEALGAKQYLFCRTRPPQNGLYWNDGATCGDPTTALSTLEAGRTIASMVDDLRSYFTPYLNSKVPVNSKGDIESTYKQVVLDGVYAQVIQRYKDSGDISDARVELVALNNDMVGTRTWEVTLAILPAPTLRWIEGYVFYVKSL